MQGFRESLAAFRSFNNLATNWPDGVQFYSAIRFQQVRRCRNSVRMSAMGVRRDKAALSSGCKPHPAIRSRRKQSEQAWR
jgi:hypothetical protein